MKTSLYDSSIVEYHQHARLQIIGQMVENILTHSALVVDKQLAVVTLLEGKLGDALVRQRIIVIVD